MLRAPFRENALFGGVGCGGSGARTIEGEDGSDKGELIRRSRFRLFKVNMRDLIKLLIDAPKNR